MTKKFFENQKLAANPSLILLIVSFSVFSYPAVATAAGCAVDFTSDVVLDLSGLDAAVNMASGSEAASLEIDETAGTLTVNAICDGGFFLLETADHKVLQLAPSGDTATFVFSSADESSGYVDQWDVTSAANVSFIVGVSEDGDYQVALDDEPISGSPFASAGGEVSFSNTGSGTYTITEVGSIEAPSLTTLEATNVTNTSATLRGNITDNGGEGVTYTGFEWGTSPGEYTDGCQEETFEGCEAYSADLFSEQLTELDEEQTYYFRSMACNPTGWGYGEEESFVTKAGFSITVTIGDKTRTITIDQEGKIIISE